MSTFQILFTLCHFYYRHEKQAHLFIHSREIKRDYDYIKLLFSDFPCFLIDCSGNVLRFPDLFFMSYSFSWIQLICPCTVNHCKIIITPRHRFLSGIKFITQLTIIMIFSGNMISFIPVSSNWFCKVLFSKSSMRVEGRVLWVVQFCSESMKCCNLYGDNSIIYISHFVFRFQLINLKPQMY